MVLFPSCLISDPLDQSLKFCNKRTYRVGQAQWYLPVIPTRGRWMDYEFKASLGYLRLPQKLDQTNQSNPTQKMYIMQTLY